MNIWAKPEPYGRGLCPRVHCEPYGRKRSFRVHFVLEYSLLIFFLYYYYEPKAFIEQKKRLPYSLFRAIFVNILLTLKNNV